MELTIYGQTLGVFKLQLIKRNSKETKRTMHKSKFVVFKFGTWGVRLHVTSFHKMLTSYLRVDDVKSENTYRVPNSKHYKFSPVCYPLFFLLTSIYCLELESSLKFYHIRQ